MLLPRSRCVPEIPGSPANASCMPSLDHCLNDHQILSWNLQCSSVYLADSVGDMPKAPAGSEPPIGCPPSGVALAIETDAGPGCLELGMPMGKLTDPAKVLALACTVLKIREACTITTTFRKSGKYILQMRARCQTLLKLLVMLCPTLGLKRISAGARPRLAVAEACEQQDL